eukprot:gnl/Chilomastix_caulleri/4711.p1 GENE.gnl/Chilomastix_caulleri/4711~~gnl/Chilomastix_caulleri/4711.p1  ORF type:complete len:69 (-),score=8.55 gnl/Chilomastix_caulleri/4711:109-315(-)
MLINQLDKLNERLNDKLEMLIYFKTEVLRHFGSLKVIGDQFSFKILKLDKKGELREKSSYFCFYKVWI